MQEYLEALKLKEQSSFTSSCDRSVWVIRYAGSVAWGERIDNLHRVSVLPVQQEPGPPSPDLVDVPPDILICDPDFEFLPDLEFLIIQKLLRYLNDIVQELSKIITPSHIIN